MLVENYFQTPSLALWATKNFWKGSSFSKEGKPYDTKQKFVRAEFKKKLFVLSAHVLLGILRIFSMREATRVQSDCQMRGMKHQVLGTTRIVMTSLVDCARVARA